MYFPYIRGRQYELLALYELVEKNLLKGNVLPIIEPVKLSPTLIKTMSKFVDKEQKIAIIQNPVVGSFIQELNDTSDLKNKTYKSKFHNIYKDNVIIKAIIMQKDIKSHLELLSSLDVKKENMVIININPGYLDDYLKEFASTTPQYVFIPGERTFSRKIQGSHLVLLHDKFEKQNRNSDYMKNEDQFFSDDHLYFKNEGFQGFSDYSIVGDDFSTSGFAPYAVAIHIVYLDSNNILRVRHFVSNSNEDITNPAGKFYEAIKKLDDWYRSNSELVEITYGLQQLLDHFKNQTYPGLGSIKKLSLMHHLELMENFLKA